MREGEREREREGEYETERESGDEERQEYNIERVRTILSSVTFKTTVESECLYLKV